MPASMQTLRRTYWNRVLLYLFWGVLATKTVVHIFVFVTAWETSFGYAPPYIARLLIPTALAVLLLGGLEGINRLYPRISEAAIAAGSYLFAFLIIASVSPDIHSRPLIMILPLLVSMIYLKSRYLIVSTVACCLAILILSRHAPDDGYFLRAEHTLSIFIFAGVAVTGLLVIRRGTELLTSLEHSLKAEQDLRIQNIIMDRLSKIDPLTDLYNHKTFHEYLEWLIDHQQSNPFPMQLAVLDIDNFKQVNDLYGHWVGDIALKQMAAVMLRHIGTDDFAARYGGEEFVVIFMGKPLEQSRAILEEIREAIAAAGIAEMGGNAITVSIGMHGFDGADSKGRVFQKADDALYQAKNSGKNKLVVL